MRTHVVSFVLPQRKRRYKSGSNPQKGEQHEKSNHRTGYSRKPKQRIRLAPYCRVSSDSEDQRHSFAAQVKYYTEYASAHPEYILADIYADEGVTGTCMNKRDDFRRLIRDCKKGKIDRVITKSVSRFARNTAELLTAVRALKEFGVSIYFEEQGIDTAAVDLEMLITFPGMAAQKESETISENMRWSYQKKNGIRRVQLLPGRLWVRSHRRRASNQ